MDQSAPRVAIVGAGIAGLAAAFFLQQHGRDTDTVVFEECDRTGGKIRTDDVDGFVLEAGPDSFLASKPEGIALCRALGLEERLQGTDERHRRTFVLAGGRLHPLPEGLSGLVPARLEPLRASTLFSDAGKRRLAAEPDVPARRETTDESLRDFMVRRFGVEVYDRLIEPLMAGIYAGEGACLSLQATFPQLATMEREAGSLLRAMAARPPAPSGPQRSGFLTPVGGMGEIVTALRSRLATSRVRTSSGVRSLSRENAGYRLMLCSGDTLTCDSVILATPAHVSARLLNDLAPDLAGTLGEIPYASTATVSLAYRDADVPGDLDGYGYIVPRAEERPVLACTWISSKFRHRAPEGYRLIRMFLGRYGQEQMLAGNDADLVALARDEAREVLGITATPSHRRLYRWPLAMPQYCLGHLQRLAAIDRGLKGLPGIYLAGSSYRGVGIPDCIGSGERAARSVIDQ